MESCVLWKILLEKGGRWLRRVDLLLVETSSTLTLSDNVVFA